MLHKIEENVGLMLFLHQLSEDILVKDAEQVPREEFGNNFKNSVCKLLVKGSKKSIINSPNTPQEVSWIHKVSSCY